MNSDHHFSKLFLKKINTLNPHNAKYYNAVRVNLLINTVISNLSKCLG